MAIDTQATDQAVKKSQLASIPRKRIVAVMALALVLAGLVGAVLVVSAHAAAESFAREQAGAIPAAVESTERAVTGPPAPRGADVTLGAVGGEEELDRCDGTFTQMIVYGSALPPVWAAHNDCLGDVILGWTTGQEVSVSADGVTATYLVVDTRDTRKKGATTEDLAGIGGAFVLQTCYYDEDRMKFIGLTPLPAELASPPAA